MSSDLRRRIGVRAVTRRSALVGLAVTGAAAAGCTPYTVDEPAVSLPTPSGPRGVDRDVLLARRMLESERSLLSLLDGVVRRHPRLAALVEPAQAAHTAHVRLLEEAVPDDLAESPGASPSPPEDVGVPRRSRGAVAALARAEDRLAELARRSAFAAESGGFARVVASMAAAATQQGALLRAGGRTEPVS